MKSYKKPEREENKRLIKEKAKYTIGGKMKAGITGLEMGEQSSNVIKAEIQLAVVKSKKSPLVEYMRTRIKKVADLGSVRKRMSKIKKPLAEDIAESRSER